LLLAERGLALRIGLALVLANVRYWTSVAPQVRGELRRWSRRAGAIPDAGLRDIALQKLRLEHFNAEVAATLATLVPRAQRARTVEAIVAFEVLYDYLDGLSERRSERPLQSGQALYRAFTDVFSEEPLRLPIAGYDDGGYLNELSGTVRRALAGLPAMAVVRPTAYRAAERCAQAQIRVHAAPQIGVDQLERWARESGSAGAAPGWREFVAGAVASVLAVHALIAAAAQGTVTEEQADAIDAAYLAISALSTMLDSLVDHEQDLCSGDPWLIRLYGDPELLAERLREVAQDAVTQARRLPHEAHHLMTLLGVVAYYTSARQARGPLARVTVVRLHRELRPLMLPTLLVMRSWRLAKAIRRFTARLGGVPRRAR
jgi:tetraprenyl-beta-curcumene synthase